MWPGTYTQFLSLGTTDILSLVLCTEGCLTASSASTNYRTEILLQTVNQKCLHMWPDGGTCNLLRTPDGWGSGDCPGLPGQIPGLFSTCTTCPNCFTSTGASTSCPSTACSSCPLRQPELGPVAHLLTTQLLWLCPQTILWHTHSAGGECIRKWGNVHTQHVHWEPANNYGKCSCMSRSPHHIHSAWISAPPPDMTQPVSMGSIWVKTEKSFLLSWAF
jgi:hypothetical protein